MTWLLVLVGGALGAPLRYLTDRAVQSRHDSVFPWGTLTVNVLGSLVLGVLAGAAVASPAYALLGTGLCGALTTYSTFSYETLRLTSAGSARYAAANAAVTVAASLGAVAAGVALGRALGG
ncbi:fluoride efflux transporter CrcB [Streptomyces thermolilacinus]|uniref:Fluoride-specific ion channel FluC n=1 Tax=Streptomyces thermolilacinus SPC6 TaxID=1306406 RepID=A0A1D3DT92_9ACTN|nr:fluoride efflux transporter CrcB [Streptomyces thermolilacinus]OEJ95536.1 CrcB protein [Streptomyces thermolilacinus SPC6]